MFTQIFQAVENLSSQPPPTITDEPLSRSNSIDSHLRPSSPLSSGQLAESALVNLRKSLAAQRPGSPSPKHVGIRDQRSPKSTLEDRLKAAAFAIGDASNPSSTGASARVSPTPSNVASQRSLSPCSTPLPESPKTTPEMEAAVPVAHPASVATPAAQFLPSSPRNSTSESTHPLLVGELSAKIEPVQDLPEASYAVLDNHPGSADIEALQERLKQVEQRFTGMHCSPNMTYLNLFSVRCINFFQEAAG